jgi:hypothetical protein
MTLPHLGVVILSVLPFLRDNLGETVGVNRFRRRDPVERLAQPSDLTAFGLKMPEELPLDLLPRDPRLVIEVILGEDPIQRVDVNLYFLEGKPREERPVDQAQKLGYLLRPLQDLLQPNRGQIANSSVPSSTKSAPDCSAVLAIKLSIRSLASS